MNDGHCRRGEDDRFKLMFIDVKKADLNGIVPNDDKLYRKLPPSIRGLTHLTSTRGICVRLKRWLYGMRPAAAALEPSYAVGFERGRASPAVFYCKNLQVRDVIHGDHFAFLGYLEALKSVDAYVRSWNELTIRGRATRRMASTRLRF